MDDVSEGRLRQTVQLATRNVGFQSKNLRKINESAVVLHLNLDLS